MNKDGGAAFPRQLPNIVVPPDEALEMGLKFRGMSLRDYFAAKAMQAFIDPTQTAWIDKIRISAHLNETLSESIARISYDYADAMIARRDK